MVPPRKKNPQPGNGKRHEANNTAIGLQVKVVCKTVKESKTWQYETRTPDYTIKASMTATISIENLSQNRYRYNLELSVSKNKLELNQKLNDFNNKAFKDLADGVKMAYESGRVTIKAPIATHAKVGVRIPLMLEPTLPIIFQAPLNSNPSVGPLKTNSVNSNMQPMSSSMLVLQCIQRQSGHRSL